MKWKDLQPGDVMIDLNLEGNDHILVARTEKFGSWINVNSGVIEIDVETSPLNDKPIGCGWLVIRGYKEIYRS